MKFGRFIGDDPYTFGHINSLTTDDEGNVYATACAGDLNQYSPILRVFAGDGRLPAHSDPLSSEFENTTGK